MSLTNIVKKELRNHKNITQIERKLKKNHIISDKTDLFDCMCVQSESFKCFTFVRRKKN